MQNLTIGSQSPLVSDEVVQVTTTLDSTVVEIEHLYPEFKTRRSWLPFACAGAFALVAGFAFFKGVSLASANDAARAAWLAAGERMDDFRPAGMSLVYDVFAFIGLIGAVLSLGLGVRGLLDRKRSTVSQPGDADSVQLPLVEATAQGAVVAPTSSMALSMVTDSGEQTIDEAVASGLLAPVGDGRLRVARGARAMFENGKSRVLVESTPAPREGTAAAALAVEGRSMQYLAGSALAHVGLLALLWSVAPDAQSLSLNGGLDNEILTKVHMPSFEEREKDFTPQGGGQNGPETADSEMQAPPDGVTGTEKTTATKGQYTIKKRQDEPVLSRSQAIERARQAGILGIYAAADPFGNEIVGTADFSSGFAAADVRGALDGEVGEVNGSWGNWGVPGGIGNGPGYGTSRSGAYALSGICSGDVCRGRGDMSGTWTNPAGRLKRDKFEGTKVDIGEASTPGADPSIVRRYIRRKLPQIRHCYERELLVNPELSGTVTTSFVISPTGKVQGTTASGSGNPKLDSCVRSVVGTIQFPRFNQMINVKYPFMFSRAG